jgi:hypothetical protein
VSIASVATAAVAVATAAIATATDGLVGYDPKLQMLVLYGKRLLGKYRR